jgi:NTE family protein
MAKRWGLALSGGGILGITHLGVIEVLLDAGLKPNYISGTSAGAIVGGLLAAGTDLSRISQEVGAIFSDKEFTGIKPLRLTTKGISGIIPGDFIETILERLIGKITIDQVEIPLALTAVDLITGSLVIFTNRPPVPGLREYYDITRDRLYFCDTKLSIAIRSSVSLPGVFSPKRYDHLALIDGGIRDIIPVYEIRRMGAEEVIAVDLGTHAEKPQVVDDLVSIISRSFSLACRNQAKQSLAQHASLVLQPDVFEIGFPSKSRIQKLIDSGRKVARAHLGKIVQLLGI